MDNQEYYDTDDVETQDAPSGKGLRSQLEQTLAANKQLQAELAELRTAQRQSEVSQFLQSKGVNSKIAKFIPSDVSGEEGLSKWLEDNADVFSIQPKETSQEAYTDPAPETSVTPTVPESATRMQSVSNASSVPSGYDNLLAEINNASTVDEVNAILAKAAQMQA